MNHKQCILSAILLFLFSAYQPQTQEKEISVTDIQTEKLINEIDVHDLQILEIDKCENIFYKKVLVQIGGTVSWLIKEIVKMPFIIIVETKMIIIELRGI